MFDAQNTRSTRKVSKRSFAYREKRKERRPRGSSDVPNTPRHFTSGTSYLVLGEGRRASCLSVKILKRVSRFYAHWDATCVIREVSSLYE